MEDLKDFKSLLVQLNERQRTIFNRLLKIEQKLDTLNSKVAEHDLELTKIMTYGGIIVIALPIIMHIIMR